MIKSLWASVSDNPKLFKALNGWLTIFWIVMVPVSVLEGWVNSVPYVSALSIYALITGHLATWQAAKVEVKQDDAEEKHENERSTDMDQIEQKVDNIHQRVVD